MMGWRAFGAILALGYALCGPAGATESLQVHIDAKLAALGPLRRAAEQVIAGCSQELSRATQYSIDMRQVYAGGESAILGHLSEVMNGTATSLRDQVAGAVRTAQRLEAVNGVEIASLTARVHACMAARRLEQLTGNRGQQPPAPPPPAQARPQPQQPQAAARPAPSAPASVAPQPPSSIMGPRAYAALDAVLAGDDADSAGDDPDNANALVGVGADATQCVLYIASNSITRPGRIFNRCPYIVEAAWCVVGFDCKPGYANMQTLGANRGYTVFGTADDGRGRRVEYAACRGANTIRPERNAARYDCVAAAR